MGEIIDIKNLPDKKVNLKILVNSEELSKIRGHMRKLHFFTSELFEFETDISNRGTNGATKYFRIPLSIRLRKRIDGKTFYQKIETPSKIFYIYTISKETNQKK